MIVKNSLYTAIFYGIAIGCILLSEYLVPSGPCTPGLGILLALFLPIISFVLLLKNTFIFFKGNNKVVGSLFIHLIAIVILIWYLKTS